jgi:hypothetical protein
MGAVTLVLLIAYAVLVAVAGFMLWACIHRACDGRMSNRAEIEEDIREDLS